MQIHYFPIIHNISCSLSITVSTCTKYQELGLKKCNWKLEQYIHWPGIWIKKITNDYETQQHYRILPRSGLLPVKRNYLAFYKANTNNTSIFHHHKEATEANILKWDFSWTFFSQTITECHIICQNIVISPKSSSNQQHDRNQFYITAKFYPRVLFILQMFMINNTLSNKSLC